MNQFCSPEVIVHHSSLSNISLEIRIPHIDLCETTENGFTFHRINIPQTGSTVEVGKPELPIIKFLVATPKGSEAELAVLEAEYEVKSGYLVMPSQELILEGEEKKGFEIDEEFYARDEYYPTEVAILGSPAVMRDLQVVGVEVHPVQYNPGQNELKTYSVIQLEINCYGGKEIASSRYSLAFKPLYESAIINYGSLQLPDSGYQPGGYLIITPAEFYDVIVPLAEWKHQKGFKTTVSKLSDIGNTVTQIKDHISDAYYNWSPPPDYVLLIGDTDRLPTHSLPYPPVPASDHYYSMLEGEDYFSELLVGRLSVATEAELDVAVSKILGYERTPYLQETSWYKRALMVGANYPAYVTTAVLTKKWIRDKLFLYGYSEVDTCFYPPTSDPTPIANSINNGVTIVNYRGWGRSDGWHYPDFRKDEVYFLLHNGWALPLVTSMTCGTGNFGITVCFGEAWLRAGTPTNPKGGIAFIGPSHLQTSTKYNNCIDAGVYQGLLDQGLHIVGQALYRGKLEIHRNLPEFAAANQNPEFYFHTYNILGDPGLLLWTDIPESLSVTHPSTVPVGHSPFELEVKDSNQEPVENALVCLWKSYADTLDEVYTVNLTDESGKVQFLIEPSTSDTMWVTVTCHNYIPYLGYVLALPGVYVGYSTHSIDDASGNGNGEVNPGETIDLEVCLKNYGADSIAHDVSAVLSAQDNWVSIIDSSAPYGDIPPAGVSFGSHGFSVLAACTSKHQIHFALNIQSGDSNWIDLFRIPVHAPDLGYTNHAILDQDSLLDPGDTSDMLISLGNQGSLEATEVTGILRSLSSAILIIDSSGSFGSIAPGDTSDNSSDPFRISADPTVAVGRRIKLNLELNGADGFADRTLLFLTIGNPKISDPLGPDRYGYFAYDCNDTGYTECPDYEWIEIDSLGTAYIMGNDETVVVGIPFDFKYYGNTYNEISICSNGWVALGSTWMVDAQNWHIPAALGPPCLIAPFWDELDPTRSDTCRIYHYHDSGFHRFIVEWKNLPLLICPPAAQCSVAALETFQVVLYDPVHYPTLTGDGEITFQYDHIENLDDVNQYATVGIENESHDDGLEYSYDGEYPPGASPLAPGLAIKFTTDPPDTFLIGVSENFFVEEPRAFSITQNFPNPFHKTTEICFMVPSRSEIEIGVFDRSGRLVRDLLHRIEEAGLKVVQWNGKNQKGLSLPAGVYFLRLNAFPMNGRSSHTAYLKMVLLK